LWEPCCYLFSWMCSGRRTFQRTILPRGPNFNLL